MKDQEWDKKITQAFKVEAEKIEVDDRVKMKIDRVIRNSEDREEKSMKHFSLRKKVILGVICCGIISTGILAASGVITSWESSTNLLTVCRDYSKLEAQEKELGFKVDVIKEFSNGYSFNYMNVDEVIGQDVDGNKIENYKEFEIAYKNAKGKNLSLMANQNDAGSKFQDTDKTLQCGDVTVYYYQDTYKVVPSDYKLTEEDKKNQEKEGYYISYGSDKVLEQKISRVNWDKDSVRYTILVMDSDMTSEEMLEMASELIK